MAPHTSTHPFLPPPTSQVRALENSQDSVICRVCKRYWRVHQSLTVRELVVCDPFVGRDDCHGQKRNPGALLINADCSQPIQTQWRHWGTFSNFLPPCCICPSYSHNKTKRKHMKLIVRCTGLPHGPCLPILLFPAHA